MDSLPSPQAARSDLDQNEASAGVAQDYTPSGSRRRKVRKGTRSCWECKRRKMKCIFDSQKNATCNGCRRRGSKCISQQYPEEVSLAIERSRKLVRLGSGLGTLADNVSESIGVVDAHGDERTHATAGKVDGTKDHGKTIVPQRNLETSRFMAFYKRFEVCIRP
jgi:hypothetical protein